MAICSVTEAGLIISEAPEDAILLGAATKGLLPAMYKVKDFKELPGLGMTSQLTVGASVILFVCS